MEKKWWKNAVVYQCYPKSFQDSNEDGIGDIQGIIERLDYLQDLGIDVLWICPVYQSPMDDNGYDISDYYHVDESFGTDEDLDRLIGEAGKRGIRILMDLVVNHTSDEHVWFREALQDPGSEYADYYIFKEGVDGGPPNNWRSHFGGSAWEKAGDNRYYLHAFSKKQPDLNWENPKLREEIYKMINYWLDKGLGGFRIDAISNIKKNFQAVTFEPDGEDGMCFVGKGIANQPGIEVFLSELKERTFQPHNSMTVAEANVPEELLDQFIGENGFFSMVFDFSYADIDIPQTGEWYKPTNWTLQDLKRNMFHSQLETQKRGWGALYLENHDQPRSLNKYLPEGDINQYSTTMLASLFMLLRGTPFIYQGQEIGMSNILMDSMDDYNDPATKDQYQRAVNSGMSSEQAFELAGRRSRDNSRTPMQWSDEKNAGFSGAESTWLKVNKNYPEINVACELKNEDSVLNFYKKLIQLRKSGKYKNILTEGTFVPEETEDQNIIAYRRVSAEGEILAIHNYQNKESKMVLDGSGSWDKIFSNYGEMRTEGNQIVLRAYEALALHCADNCK